jgi:NADH-quinone oxidoreductase subunit G
VNTFPQLPFTSYFSGNTVQICPVGALTATPYRFTARPWDLDQVESTCTTCSVGCRVAVQSSSNRVTRLLGIDSDPVNHGWLCDKGRFVYGAVNSDDRLTEPMVRKDGELVATSWHEALSVVAEGLKGTIAKQGAEAIGVLGGARLTNEGAYAWARLAKGVLGTDAVDAQMGDGLQAEVVLGLPRATIDQAAAADTVIVLSGDVREELPILFLRLRSAIVDGDLSLVELSPQATSLTEYADVSLRYGPGDAIGVVQALFGSDAPGKVGAEPDALAEARRLAGADNVVVIAGRPSVAEDGVLVAEALQNLAQALPRARFLPALRRGNVLGALDMGLAPGVLPGRVSLDAGRAWFTEAWGSVPAARGRDAAAILASAAGGQGDGQRISSLVMLGADPLTDFPDRRLAERALDGAEFVVAVATTAGPVTERADVVLPAAEAHERPGTTTNIEGRISRLGQKLVPPGQAWADWMIAAELAVHLESDFHLDSVGAVWDEIEQLATSHRGITRAVLDARGTTDGVVAPLVASSVSITRRPAAPPLDPIAVPGVESAERQGAPPRAGLAELPNAGSFDRTADRGSDDADHDGGGADRPEMLSGSIDLVVPRVGPVDSYSLRLVASRALYDNGAGVSAVPALAGLVATAPLRANPHDLDDLGVPAGGSVRVRTASASAVLIAMPDASLPRKVVATEFNVPLGDGTVGDLIDIGAPVVELRMETP